MLKVGLTGGIGSGKTTVANLFNNRSIPIIDADEISHSLVERGKPGLQAIVDHFGNAILDQNGHLNRPALRKIVFDCSQKKTLLESILHPLVYRTIEDEMESLISPYCILSIPLLLETNAQKRIDRILVVDCPVELQYTRVKARDQLDSTEIKRILKAQTTRKQKLEAADDLIVNVSDIASLDKQIEKLHNFYLELSKKIDLSN